MPKPQITLRIICVDPIRQCLDAAAIQFGLQDKKGNLLPGHEQSADEIVFEFALSVSRHSDGRANFTGAFAQGPRDKRFIYLTYKVPEGESWRIYRRLKVPLAAITWRQVETALARRKVLRARVSGLRSGTAPLLDDGWLILD